MRVLVILGMHRSGTSLLARISNLLGANIGNKLLAPQTDNPTGFWELQKIQEIHDELLSTLGLSWYSLGNLPSDWLHQPEVQASKRRLLNAVQVELMDAELPCIKDPRICRLIPLWEEVFQQLNWEPSYLHVARNPVEVAQSLKARDGFVFRKSYLLWLRHVLEAERYTRDRTRSFVGYDDLLKDWRQVMNLVWPRLGLGVLKVKDSVAEEIDHFIRPELNHYQADAECIQTEERPSTLVNETFRACMVARQSDNSETKQEFSRIRSVIAETACLYEPILVDTKQRLAEQNDRTEAELKSLETQHSAALARVEQLTADVNHLNNNIAQRDNAINSILSSTSWRLTSPLRGAKTTAQRVSMTASNIIFKSLQTIYQHLPLSDDKKAKLRSHLSSRVRIPLLKPAQTTVTGYQNWIEAYDALDQDDKAAILEHIEKLPRKPLISILMPVYNTKESFLHSAIESVMGQLYPNWELCIADDCSTESHVSRVLQEYQKQDERIKVVFRKENGNISACSNSALELVSGDFLALMDHDDVLPEHALYMVALAINENANVDIIYSDEDKIDENNRRSSPYFKSDWNPDLFYAQNMINHLVVYRTSIVKEMSGFRLGFEGSQDYDLALRIVERTVPKNIVHIPDVLYHWRMTASSSSFSQKQLPQATSAARRAVDEHFERLEVNGVEIESAPGAEHYQRIRRPVPKPEPLVSLIIPTKDKVKLLRQCIHSILSKTAYAPIEVIIVNNGSADPETIDYLKTVQEHDKVRVVNYDGEFNYSAINNFAIHQSKGEIIGLVNNDIVVINSDWLGELVSHAVRPEVGAVGAKLYYPNNTVQHAGIIMGIGGVAGHGHKHFERSDTGYFGRLLLTQNMSGVTGACVLIRRGVIEECGGLDETNLGVAFNDVDLCLRIRERGYLIVWTPYAELYHLESASRGLDTASDKVKRFQKEQAWMKRRWGNLLIKDPYYNPNLTLERDDFSLASPPRLNKPWNKYASFPKKKNSNAGSLINTGITILREPSNNSPERTMVVLGLARSGTSMIAGALYHLGIFMGDKLGNINFEDRTLSSAIEAGNDQQVDNIIKARNKKYAVWGWKRPSSIRFIGDLENRLRNPFYVVVFRDVFSIANRNKISMLTDIVNNMKNSLSQYSKLIKFIEKSEAPCMLVSYEKAVASSEVFVNELADFAGLDDKRSIQSAIEFINPNAEKYIDHSRITKCTGVLEQILEDKVCGWVKSIHDPKRILEVRLFVNNIEIQKTKASLPRKDLIEKGVHPNGNCGFEFALSNHQRLGKGDEVRVMAIGDIHDLANSPYKYGLNNVTQLDVKQASPHKADVKSETPMNILVIGKAKTGTTVVSKSIQHSIPGAVYHIEPKAVGFFLNKDHLSRQNVVKIIYEHWDATPHVREAILHNELMLKFGKTVAIVRDLRDEVISRLFYITRALAKRGSDPKDLNKWLAFIEEKERNPKDISFLEMVKKLNEIFGTKMTPRVPRDEKYLKFLDRHAPRICIIKYEDFMENQLGALESYLGFELSNDRDVGVFDWTKRTSTYNNWKRFFTNADVEELQALYEPVLSRWGYTDWELDPDPVLKPEEYSGYVKRIVAGVHPTARAYAKVEGFRREMLQTWWRKKR